MILIITFIAVIACMIIGVYNSTHIGDTYKDRSTGIYYVVFDIQIYIRNSAKDVYYTLIRQDDPSVFIKELHEHDLKRDYKKVIQW